MQPIKHIDYTEEMIRANIDKLLKKENVSFTAIQWFFDIGYPNAGRIIDEMKKNDLIIGDINAKYNLEKKEDLEDYLYNKFKLIHSC